MSYRWFIVDSEAGVGAKPENLRRLESLIGGAQLPADYALFLTECGGGRPVRDVAVFLTPTGVEDSPIRSFFPATAKEGSDSVVTATESLASQGLIPPTVLVIAEDQFGNLLCLSSEVGSFGAILFWDHERILTDKPETATLADHTHCMIQIADSFEDLTRNCLFSSEGADQRKLELMESVAGPLQRSDESEPSASGQGQPMIGLEGPTSSIQVYKFLREGPQADAVYPKPFAAVRSNDGVPLSTNWVPPTVEWVDADTDSTDFPYCSQDVLLLRQEVVDRLGDLFRRYGELLLVDGGNSPLYLFRCLNVIDALAADAEIESWDDGYVEITGPSFEPDVVAGAGIFTLTQQPLEASLFFSRRAAQAIIESGLRHEPITLIWGHDE